MVNGPEPAYFHRLRLHNTAVYSRLLFLWYVLVLYVYVLFFPCHNESYLPSNANKTMINVISCIMVYSNYGYVARCINVVFKESTVQIPEYFQIFTMDKILKILNLILDKLIFLILYRTKNMKRSLSSICCIVRVGFCTSRVLYESGSVRVGFYRQKFVN